MESSDKIPISGKYKRLKLYSLLRMGIDVVFIRHLAPLFLIKRD